jgi:hypothetical protein
MARKDSPKWRNTLKCRNKSACKDSQFFDRSAVDPLRFSSPPNRAGFFVRATVLVMPAHSHSKERRRFDRLCRGHPRLCRVHQIKDVDGRNKSGHDGGHQT